MKKIQLVARRNIIKGIDGGYHNDEGLRALNGIRYGAVKEIEDDVDPSSLWDQLLDEFENDNPDFAADIYTIQVTTEAQNNG